jgi:hypothetical protein
MKHRMKYARYVVYGLLGAAIVWQGAGVYRDVRTPAALGDLRKIAVEVTGNVSRPGSYLVAEGATHFEILKVAGVNMTSDLTPFNLAGQVEEGQTLSVGSLEKPVGLNASMRLEFYLGELDIIGGNGMERPVREGMSIEAGDRIMTQEKSQAELSINGFSRVDMDFYSDLTVDKLQPPEKGEVTVELFQKAGLCWYQMVYAETDESYKIVTPLAEAVIGGKGADFTIEVSFSQVVINNTDGLLLVERGDGEEAINLIAGQSVTIHSDGRPFQISELAPDISMSERFSQLGKLKTDAMMRHMPFNFLFCGLPMVFYVVSVQFDRSEVHVVHLPSNTSVSQFAQGFATLQEAFLYGGPVFASTLVERILDAKIPKYVIFERDDIMRTASSVGGVMLAVDQVAAGAMGTRAGKQRLAGQRILSYLRTDVSGVKDSELRQLQVLRALFESLKNRDIVLNAMLAEQILANIDANITASEVMKHYDNFSNRSNWNFRTHELPNFAVNEQGRALAEPDLSKSRGMLNPSN